jgi:hypothetical protein
VIDYYHSDAAAAAAEAAAANSTTGITTAASTAVVPRSSNSSSSSSSSGSSSATTGSAAASDRFAKGEVKSIIVDVRPAIDGFDSFIFRCMKMPAFRKFDMTPFQPLPFFLPPAFKAAVAGSSTNSSSSRSSTTTAVTVVPSDREFAVLLQQMQDKCRFKLEALNNCTSEENCAAASIALKHCMGSIACEKEAAVFAALFSADDPAAEGAFESMQTCLEKVEQRARASRAAAAAASAADSTAK